MKLVPITWRNAPENQHTVAGKDYVVQCDVTSNPAPAVDWLRNGDQVWDNSRSVHLNFQILTYYFLNFRLKLTTNM